MTPSAEWFGLTILEPTTMLTDFAISAVAWWASWQLLFHVRHRPHRCRRLWGIGLLFIGLGALFGGLSHGFAAYLDDTADAVIWKSTVYAIGLSMVFAVAGSISGSPLGATTSRSFCVLNVIAFVLYAAWMIGHDDFLYVIYYYVPAMLCIAALHGRAHLKYRSDGAAWIMSGVVVTLLGAVVQQSKISLHLHFNHNDLFHVIQIIGLALFFRGVSVLRVKAPGGCVAHQA